VTAAQIAEGLTAIVLRLANPEAPDTLPPGWTMHEWAYVRGIAAGAIARARDEFVRAPAP
jgi:hypothetical protein